MIRRSDDCSSRRVPFGVGDPRPLAAGGCGVAVEHDRIVRRGARRKGKSSPRKKKTNQMEKEILVFLKKSMLGTLMLYQALKSWMIFGFI